MLRVPIALVVSRYFPPLSSAGASIRLIKFMKYAAGHGWTFAVLTQDPTRPVIPEKRLSEFLLDEVPAGTVISRVGNPIWRRRGGRPWTGRTSLPWGLAVAWRGWRQYRRQHPDLIFVNSPPFTNVAIGLFLAGRFGVPLVLDMKDDWVGSPAFRNKGRLRQALERWVEGQTMRRAAAVIVVTGASYEDCQQRYPRLAEQQKFFCIPNGEDLAEYRSLAARQRQAAGPRFRLLSAAAGYRPDYRDLTPLLQALERWLQRYPAARDEIEVEFLGEEPADSYKAWLARLLPAAAVHYRGALDRSALVEQLWQADLFFLVQPQGNYTAISGTLYEYWATGKAPVLLFAEAGASSELVRSQGLGEHFQFDQVDAASHYIERLVQAHHNAQPVWIDRAGSEAFDRRALTEQLLSIWSAVLTPTRKI